MNADSVMAVIDVMGKCRSISRKTFDMSALGLIVFDTSIFANMPQTILAVSRCLSGHDMLQFCSLVAVNHWEMSLKNALCAIALISIILTVRVTTVPV